jgi:hypothetical protein
VRLLAIASDAQALAPQLTTALTLPATAAAGAVLSVPAAVWDRAGVATSYQWLVDGLAVAGATGRLFTVRPDHIGHTLAVMVRGTVSGYNPALLVSDVVATSAASGPDPNPAPYLFGVARVGEPLTVVPGVYAAPGATEAYAWSVGGTPTGQTGSVYVPTAADQGQVVTVTVTATWPGGTWGPASSATTTLASAAVAEAAYSFPTPAPADAGRLAVPAPNPAAATPAPADGTGAGAGGATPSQTASPDASASAKAKVKVGTVAIKGKVKVGRTLKATVKGATSGATVTYRWLRGGKAIKGATKATYKLTAKDRGKRISVRITLTKSGYTKAVKTTKKTAKVA